MVDCQTNMLNKNKGISFIEVMIILAIIAILASVAIPEWNKYHTPSEEKIVLKSKEWSCLKMIDREIEVNKGTYKAPVWVKEIRPTCTEYKRNY